MNNSENLELASISSRAKAFIIDDLLISLVFVVLFWEQITSSDGELMNMLIIMNENVLQVLFLKIKVIDYNTFGRVSLMSSLIRSMIRIFSEMFFYIGFIFGFFNDGKQTLHDKIGRTLVVNA